MRITFYMLIAAVLTGCGASENSSATQNAPPAAPMIAPDLDRIAESVVTRTASVKEGDVVLITGGVRDVELLENLAIEVRKVGGHPLVSLASERMTRRFYDDVPARYDSARPRWAETLMSTVDVQISVDNAETPDLLAHVPPERIAAVAKAGQKSQEIRARRNMRFVNVGNSMYPTHASASRFGISRDEMARFFWNAISTDFTEIQSNSRQLMQILATTRQLHVTTPNGTDLRLAILPNTIKTSDGTIYDAAGNLKAPNAYLPAGEVYALTVPGSANGRIVVDYYFDRGDEIRDLTIEVVNGRMVSMKAASAIDALQADFDAAEGGKDLLSILDFGMNPGITAAGTKLRTWVAVGTVTPVFGSDVWAGGSNYTALSIEPFLANATVSADGRVIVENGQLKL